MLGIVIFFGLCPWLSSSKVLRFNKDSTFRIALFTDLHYGESAQKDSSSDQVGNTGLPIWRAPRNSPLTLGGLLVKYQPAFIFTLNPKRLQVQRTILATEKPDFVVYGGDMVSGWNGRGQNGWFAEHWRQIIAP
jgi:hypothetical protein